MNTPEIVRMALNAKSRKLAIPEQNLRNSLSRISAYQRKLDEAKTRRLAAIIGGTPARLFDEQQAELMLTDFNNFFLPERYISEGILYNPDSLMENQLVARHNLTAAIRQHYHPSKLKVALAYFLLNIKKSDWSVENEFLDDARNWNQLIVPMIDLYPSRINKLQLVNDFLVKMAASATLDQDHFQI